MPDSSSNQKATGQRKKSNKDSHVSPFPPRVPWKKNFRNGDTYDGEAVAATSADGSSTFLKDGKGCYTWAANKAVYDGTWLQDQPHGEGVMQIPGSEGYTYTGGYSHGKRSGKGMCRFENGRVYVGSWKNDAMDGEGTLHGSPSIDDFEEYIGSFQRGHRSGHHGRCVYRNGDRYDGDWLDDQRHGRGELHLHPLACSVVTSTLVTDSAVLFYSGCFERDAAVSGGEDAELQYADGSSYRGGVDHLQRHGNGVHRLANGDVYDGGFARDQRDGRGTLQVADGTVYEATWRRNQMDGMATISFPATSLASTAGLLVGGGTATDGASLPLMRAYRGPCVAGQLTGTQAAITYTDQSTYNGPVQDGLPSGSAGVLQNRVLNFSCGAPITCRQGSASTTVLLSRYQGSFAAGLPEGTGVGDIVCTATGASAVAPGDASAEWLSKVAEWRPSYTSSGTYTGQWSHGLPYGRGSWSWADGSTYVGDVAAYVAHGHGCFIGQGVRYDGMFAEGYPDGRGSWSMEQLGLSYEGEWKVGQPDGSGTFVSSKANRASYKGSWVGGQRSGYGIESTVPDGRVLYKGLFANNNRNGSGSVYFTDEEKKLLGSPSLEEYTGMMAMGSSGGGEGCLRLADGTTVTGIFESGFHPAPSEEVTVAAGNGSWTYIGSYDWSMKCGHGKMKFSNGDAYDGEVEDIGNYTLQRHGKGVYSFVEGNHLRCTWQHNVLNGAGVYVTSTGEQTSRNYVDGVLVGGAATGSTTHVFTPENEFPNTQSELALGERKAQLQQQQQFSTNSLASPKGPFKFTKRGEARQAAGSGAAGAVAIKQDPAISPKRRRSAGATGAPEKQNSLDPFRSSRTGPADGVRGGDLQSSNQARGAANSAAGGISPTHSTITASTSPGDAVSKGSAARTGASSGLTVTSTTPAYSLRRSGKKKPVTVEAAARPPVPSPVSTAEGSSPSRERKVGSAYATSSSSFCVRQFQKGITRLSDAPDTENVSASLINRNCVSPGTTPAAAQRRTMESIMAPLPRTQADSKVSPTPKKPLEGTLRRLMEDACSIRNTKEDEIYLLTEEMRVLNERIWQLRFSMNESSEKSGSKSSRQESSVYMAAQPSSQQQRHSQHPLQKDQQERLNDMVKERKSVVDKLQCLLSNPF